MVFKYSYSKAIANLIREIRVLGAALKDQVTPDHHVVLTTQRLEAAAQGEMHPEPQQIITFP